MLERAPGLDQGVLLGHHRTAHPPADTVSHAGHRMQLGLRLPAPALDQQNALSGVEQINGARRHVVQFITIAGIEGIHAGQQSRSTKPVPEDRDIVTGLHAAVDLNLLIREQGFGHIPVHHLDAKQIARIRQIALGPLAVIEDVAPGLGANVDRWPGWITPQADFHPAKTSLERIFNRIGALKHCPIGVIQVFEQLGFKGRIVACSFTLIGSHHHKVHPALALGADQPVNGRLDFVEYNRVLAALPHPFGILVFPLGTVIESLALGHHGPVGCLA